MFRDQWLQLFPHSTPTRSHIHTGAGPSRQEGPRWKRRRAGGVDRPRLYTRYRNARLTSRRRRPLCCRRLLLARLGFGAAMAEAAPAAAAAAESGGEETCGGPGGRARRVRLGPVPRRLARLVIAIAFTGSCPAVRSIRRIRVSCSAEICLRRWSEGWRPYNCASNCMVAGTIVWSLRQPKDAAPLARPISAESPWRGECVACNRS
jgi:hypothetical protein